MFSTLAELLLQLLGISSDPTENIRSAMTALYKHSPTDYFNADFLVTYGLAFGIGMFVSMGVVALVAMRSLRPGASLLRVVLTSGYYGETLLVGSLLLFVAKWVDDMAAQARETIFSMMPEETVNQFVLSFNPVSQSFLFKVASGIATGMLKIEADLFSRLALLMVLAFIIVYPLYHLDARGPRATVSRWLIVSIFGTTISMLWLVGGALIAVVYLNEKGQLQPIDLRYFTLAVVLFAAFAPLTLNTWLKRSQLGKQLTGAVRISNTVRTTSTATPAPARRQKGKPSAKLIEARNREANKQWLVGAARHPERVLSLWGPTRPVGGAISLARGLRRK